MLYFAYGSNMASLRLKQRVASAHALGPAFLPGHQLHWHVKSPVDKSAKCNALLTGYEWDIVYGVLFEIDPGDKVCLDSYEGVGESYEVRLVSVRLHFQVSTEAFAYFALHSTPAVHPFHWYKEHVIRGALEHGLPQDYIACLRQVASVPDSNEKRAFKEMSIYE